jgi:CelD/BcsL family acetyltransferase involved in cellulose biosynthesis
MAEAPSQRAADASPEAGCEPTARVVVHDSLAGLAELEAAWRGLASQPRVAGPFLGFDWIRTWAELFTGARRRLHVAAVHRGAELLGIAPWVVCEPERAAEPRCIRLLGAEHTACDYLDVLCAPHAERSVAQALYAHLFGPSAPRWHRLELQGVRADSAFLFHFGACFETAGKRIEVNAGIYCPTRRLEAGSVIARLPARRQKRLRYEQHVLERTGQLTLETRGAREPELAEAIAALAALYRKRWGGDRDALRCVEAYARRAGSASDLRVDLLRLDGRALAGLLQLQRGDALFLYLTAVDREAFPKLSVGNVLLGMALERAANEGVQRYDFLRGAEDYKLLWSDGAERGLDFTAYRPGAALLVQLALARARELVKIAWR